MINATLITNAAVIDLIGRNKIIDIALNNAKSEDNMDNSLLQELVGKDVAILSCVDLGCKGTVVAVDDTFIKIDETAKNFQKKYALSIKI